MSRKLDHRVVYKVLAAPVAVIAAAALATGCSSSKSNTKSSTGAGVGTATNTGAGGGTQIQVKDFAFSPDTLTVKVGTQVTWKFDDSAAHTVKADDGSFKSDGLSGGKTFSFTFNKAGEYKYICSIHPSMKAQINVQ